MTRNTFRVFTAAAALCVCAMTASANSSHSAMPAHDAAQTLQELRKDKRMLATRMDELNMLARNNHLTSWQSHAIVFDEIRSVINRAGSKLAKLEGNLEALPAAKRAAAEAIRTDLARIAPEVQSLMEEMRDFQLVTLRPDYTARVRALAERAVEARRNTDRVVRMALNASATTPSGD